MAKTFSWSDIPPRFGDGAKFMPGPRKAGTNSRDVIRQAADGRCTVVSTVPDESSAWAMAIRLQKLENPIDPDDYPNFSQARLVIAEEMRSLAPRALRAVLREFEADRLRGVPEEFLPEFRNRLKALIDG